MLKVHILVDDRVRKRGLLAEHGLSLWIEKDNKFILFDTGQSFVYCNNAKAVDIDLELTDYIVISHGHYDHCGGLQFFPYKHKRPKIFTHPDAFIKKYVSNNNGKSYREVGIPFDISSKSWIDDSIVYTKYPFEIDKGIILSGEIPCSNSFEKVPKNFYIEKNGKKINDTILDEQMLIIEDNDEIAIFLGCSHPGVINSINYAKKLMPNKDIKLLIAGMHLENTSSKQLDMTIQHLLNMNIKTIIPLHCTGLEAMCKIKQFLGDNCLIKCAGDIIEI